MIAVKNAICMASLLALLTLNSTANATVIYDEASDGDAGVLGAGIQLGVLGAGYWEVINGSLDGGLSGTNQDPTLDEFDDYYFTTSGSWTVDLTFLNLISTNFLLTVQLLSNGAVVGPLTADNASSSDIFNGAFAAGNWGLRLLPGGNAGQLEYGFAINTDGDGSGVPAPATPLIFGLGLILLGLGRRAGAARKQ